MRIAIIGGGAAGLMAAAAILEKQLAEGRRDAEVVLIERNDGLGKKVLISGGGRCNVTTGVTDIRTVLAKYPRGNKFLNSAMRRFPPDAVRAWFESHGVPLKCEEDLRVFPVSDNGADVVGAFERLFAANRDRVTVMLGRAVQGVTRRAAGGFAIAFKDGGSLDCDKLILTTGGQAYRHTGSVGDGYAFAESLGHSITPLAPSLNSFFTREKWPADISGLSFERAELRCAFDKPYSFTGPMLFTHRGVSGPAVFALSGLIAFQKYDAARPMALQIDLFPDESSDALRGRIESALRENPRKNVVNVLDFFMPKSLAEILCREAGVPGDMNGADVSKKQIAALSDWLKGVPLTVTGRGAGDEFVTAGGVSLDEVDQRTMESKITPGLFFAGELLDIDGFTGGFNLQASWACGRVAGESAGE